MKKRIRAFAAHLAATHKSDNTIRAYLCAVRQFDELRNGLTREGVSLFKTRLVESHKPKTVNLYLLAVNAFLAFLGRADLKIPLVRIQQKPFLENVISEADYLYFKQCLDNEAERRWYFVIRFLAATGARISELLQLKLEHVRLGHLDLYAKGGKMRRIYIPAALRTEALDWFERTGVESGFLFRNPRGARITARGIASHLKTLAAKYKLDPAVVYPHSFRHRFAKSFLERCGDIALLADLMGHESIETTRIYLRRTSTEQRAVVDEVVTW